MNDSRNIRNILDDIQDIINESYVFDKNSSSANNSMRPAVQQNIQTAPENKVNETDIDDSKKSDSDINSEISNIRKTSLNLLSKLDPSENPVECKLVTTIWNACDKYLFKEEKSPKETNI